MIAASFPGFCLQNPFPLCFLILSILYLIIAAVDFDHVLIKQCLVIFSYSTSNSFSPDDEESTYSIRKN